MPVSVETRERLLRMSERLSRALAQPLPDWLRTAVQNCLIELDRLRDGEPRGLEIAGVLARGESLLSVCEASGNRSSSGG
jgi:hypothetical protein